MSKLFKLREWLTLDEASEYLTLTLGEDVRKQDIYRLALDGNLKLSVDFVNTAYVKKGEIVGIDEVEYFDLNDGVITGQFLLNATRQHLMNEGRAKIKDALDGVIKSIYISDGRFLNLQDEIERVDGVWDLPMLGDEKNEVEYLYQAIVGGPEVTVANIEGSFVEKGGVTCQLQESFERVEQMPGSLAHKELLQKDIILKKYSKDEEKELWDRFNTEREKYRRTLWEGYFPSNLPSDSALVMRVSALEDFIKSLGEEGDKPLHVETLFTNIPIQRKPELLKLCMKLAERHIKHEGSYPDALELWNMLIEEYADGYDQEQRVIAGLSGGNGLSDKAFRKKFDEWTKLAEIKTD